jgi:hypothetical protein
MSYNILLETQTVFSGEIPVFCQVSRKCQCGEKDPISSLKHPCRRKSSFQKIIQFALGNNALDSNTLNRDGFLSSSVCVFSS